jgi:hypothetical protein
MDSLLWGKETHHLAQQTWSVPTTLQQLCRSQTAFDLARERKKKIVSPSESTGRSHFM